MDVVTKFVELLIDPIGHQIGYVFNYNDNIHTLQTEAKRLKDARTRVEHDMDEAKRRNEEIEPEVLSWFEEVNEVTEKADKIFEDEGEAKKRCFTGSSFNLKIRHQLSRRAKKEKQVVVQLQKRGKFDKVSYHGFVPPIGPDRDYESFESRRLVFEAIMAALKDSDVDLIGVHGMPGVGKTTLAKKVASQVKEARMFDAVVMAKVTQNPDLKRIQGEIADDLRFKFEAETTAGRARWLSERLKKETKVLVVLDDIWASIELDEIGIPLGDHKGCKILMTSRNKNVVSREMGAKMNLGLEVLAADEAWNLFEKMVGDVVKDGSIQPVAEEVAKRCGGLPISLVTVGRALRNASLDEWKDSLKQLKRSDNDEVDKKVHSALQLSYDFLKGNEIKLLFLLCEQFLPYRIPIIDLLEYTVGLGLFTQCNTLEEIRTRLHKLLNDLKASYFLLEGDNDMEVSMHDVVHKFATSVASRDHQVFSLAYGTELKQWPGQDMFEQCTAINLPFCEIPELPAILECPKLGLFMLGGNDISLKVPDNLFKEMKELKVLDLSALHFSQLPPSLQFLEKLQTLCLEYCVLEDVSMIGELKMLKVLSFKSSDIARLPNQIAQLTRLQLLNLNDCEKLQVIPPNVLSCLTQLEDLYLKNSFVQWQSEELKSQKNNASLSELKHLPNLVTLDIHIKNAEILPKDLFSNKLERFSVLIGDEWDWSGTHGTSRTLKLNSSIELVERVEVLLNKTEHLYLEELKGVKDVVCELDGQGFHQLKHLHARNSLEIQYIIDVIGISSCIALPRLESLFLDNLINLEKISHGPPLMADSFSNLKKLKVGRCHKLKYIIPFSMVRCLSRLEEIHVARCKIIEVIVSKDSEDTVGDEVIEWSQLRGLVLEYLPQFSNICSKLMVITPRQQQQPLVATGVSSTEIVPKNKPETTASLFNRKVVFPNLEDLKISSIKAEKIWHQQLTEVSSWVRKLTSLIVDDCESLNYILTSSMVESLSQLKKLEICDCKSVKEIIAVEGSGDGEITLPNLQFLKLKGLQKLVRFCSSNLIACPSLKVLKIQNCSQLKTFVSVEEVAANNEPEETNFILFDEKVQFPNLEELQVSHMHKLNMIWNNQLQEDSFCKLEVLKVEYAAKLLKVFPPNMLRRFLNLEELVVSNCDSLEEVFDLQAVINAKLHPFPANALLRTLKLRDLWKLKHIWNEDPKYVLSFQNQRSVVVYSCPGLRSLFPASIARSLPQLEYLVVKYCGVQEIVAQGEGVKTTPKFVFRKLKSIYLYGLNELIRFYPEDHTLDCPMLEDLSIYHCDGLEVFSVKPHNLQGANKESQLQTQVQRPLFSFEKVIPNLKELLLNSKDISLILQNQFPADLFHNLKEVWVQCFHDESASFPIDVLQKFQYIKSLGVSCSEFKELFSNDVVSEEKHGRTLSQIRCLHLANLSKLRHIWSKESQPDRILPNLQTLRVLCCKNLVNLTTSSSCFQNLTTLIVRNCDGLLNVVTSSTAKCLVQLSEMEVRGCKSVTEIIANEGDEAENEIIFGKLESLAFCQLESLGSFYTASCKLKFPSLKEVIVKECPKMKVFSQGDCSTPKLWKVWPTEEKDKERWEGTLNATIEQLYKKTIEGNTN